MKPRKKPIAQARTASIQAPTGGLNAKDPIADMKESEAVIMTNWFPGPSSVSIRNGFTSQSTGLGAAVETLLTYRSGTSNKLFGVAGGKIYDCTSLGAVGGAVVTGLSNSRLESINIGTSGGRFMLCVNGADKLRGYNGSTWWTDGDGAHDISGVDTSTIANIGLFKRRVWLIEKNTLHAWYLAVDSIAGAASNFDLSSVFRLGGYLMTMATWTIDNIAGIDDYAAFISSEGEIALYKGTDPTDADAWALVGIFRIGHPIGRRCSIKVGSDVLVICVDGAFPLSKALLSDRSQTQDAITDKITNLVNQDIQSYSGNFGWQPILHPIGNKLIINVPQVENSIQYQYVMNTITGAWCKFTGWNACCFAELEDSLYFGCGDGNVYEADTGDDDNGSNIETDVQQAFSYFGAPGQIKKFSLARPIFITNGDLNPAITLNIDFGTMLPTYAPSFTTSGTSLWDSSPWDTSMWSVGDTISKKWQSVTGVGYSGGLRVKTTTKNISVQWVSTDFTYEAGGVL